MANNGVTTAASLESPFLEAFSLERAEEQLGGPSRIESPFVSGFGTAETFEGGVPAESEDAVSARGELYDSEFEEALYELVQEASSVIANQAAQGYQTGEVGAGQQLLEAWAEPLSREGERLFEALSESFGRARQAALTEMEVDRLVDEAAARHVPLEPALENFFGKLIDKAKALAKKGLALANKFSPLHILLGKVKGLIRPMIQKVLRMAMDKLPPSVRPLAARLATQFLPQVGQFLPGQPGMPGVEAAPDVGIIQHELDHRVVSLMFARDPTAQELMLMEAVGEASGAAEAPPIDLRDVDAARARFAQEISRADPAEVGPVVERFIPAILPALKMGISVVGRPRVVGMLSNLVSGLVAKFVGKEGAPALSRAIVDTGLRMLSLEATEQESNAGPNAIAATVEDVVRRLSELEESEAEDARLLEAAVQEAFARSAAAHFPGHLLQEDVRETAVAAGTWVLQPRSRYMKYTRVFDVEITPQVAKAIQTFGGTTLDSFFKDRLRISLPVRGRAHLYQAVPGTWISKIVRGERNVAGLGPTARGAWRFFHPLSTNNAGMLLREPGLGRDVDGRFLSSRHLIAVGQRLFYIEIPGVRISPQPGRESEVNVTLDFPANQIRVAVFVSERESQGVAQRLSAGGSVGPALALVRTVVDAGVRTALSGDLQRHVRIVHEAVSREEFLGAALNRIAPIVLDKLVERVVDWVLKAAADYLQQQASTFVAATRDPADGVTITVTLRNPPGFGVIRTLLRGGALSLFNPLELFRGAPTASLSIAPGFVA